MSLEVADGAVRHGDALTRFVGLARDAGIDVEAVEGDPRMVEPAGLAAALVRARAIARYRREAPPAARLADEVEEVFRRAETGTLAVLPGSVPRVLRLEAEGVVDGAAMYRRAHRTTIRADRLSFLGDEARMTALAHATAPVFSAWPSFAGFAFHGLQWEVSSP